MLFDQLDIIFSGRYEDIYALESRWSVPAMFNVRMMNADVSGFHQELLIAHNMLFRALEDDQDLFHRVFVDGEGGAGRLLDEAQESFFREDEPRADFFG